MISQTNKTILAAVAEKYSDVAASRGFSLEEGNLLKNHTANTDDAQGDGT
jgi:hypothetical protein